MRARDSRYAYPDTDIIAPRLLSIPHATSPPVHQALSVSPTNSNMTQNPAKESSLAESKPAEDEPIADAEEAEEAEEEA